MDNKSNEDIIEDIIRDLYNTPEKFSRDYNGKIRMKHRLKIIKDLCKTKYPDKIIDIDLVFFEGDPVFNFKITQEYTVKL